MPHSETTGVTLMSLTKKWSQLVQDHILVTISSREKDLVIYLDILAAVLAKSCSFCGNYLRHICAVSGLVWFALGLVLMSAG
jgi:hypothetical protein